MLYGIHLLCVLVIWRRKQVFSSHLRIFLLKPSSTFYLRKMHSQGSNPFCCWIPLLDLNQQPVWGTRHLPLGSNSPRHLRPLHSPAPSINSPLVEVRHDSVNAATLLLTIVICFAKSNREKDKTKESTSSYSLLFFGDPYGNRTHVTAVKGPCLNRLTNGPYIHYGCNEYMVAEVGLEPTTIRV